MAADFLRANANKYGGPTAVAPVSSIPAAGQQSVNLAVQGSSLLEPIVLDDQPVLENANQAWEPAPQSEEVKIDGPSIDDIAPRDRIEIENNDQITGIIADTEHHELGDPNL